MNHVESILLNPSKNYSENPAVIDSATDQTWTHAELGDEASSISLKLNLPRKGLVFCFCFNDFPTVAGYRGTLKSKHSLALFDGAMRPHLKSRLIGYYQPDFILESTRRDVVSDHTKFFGGGAEETPCQYNLQEITPSGISIWKSAHSPKRKIHDSLSLLLPTSGTTGDQKLVGLTIENLEANAQAISQNFEITPPERAITSLGLHYSFGLSVLNSHLISGASCVLTDHSVMRPEFWDIFNRYGCSTFTGVPYSFSLLERIKFKTLSLPTLSTMTLGGGAMHKDLVLKYDSVMKARKGRFFVRYGQTEGTANMSCLLPKYLPEKAGSIGKAIPGGKLQIKLGDQVVSKPFEEGELVYSGKNVMLGYIRSSEDLEQGDRTNGSIRTGDLGFFDEDGFFFITGRMKRFSKIFGLRINLDDIESLLRKKCPVAAILGDDEKIIIFGEFGGDGKTESYRDELSRAFKVHRKVFEFHEIPSLPILGSGKIDYKTLKEKIHFEIYSPKQAG